jgi:maleylacetoacetate isomerase/maleylpyruvate isomerase
VSLTLYTYFRSSAAYRVRIALALKGLSFEPRFIHLVRGEQRSAEYLALNPEGLVPALVDDGEVMTQSLAIIEYLEETHPAPPLLPRTPRTRAFVRAVALAIACDIHPITNPRITGYLGYSEEGARRRWIQYWTAQGLQALERRLRDHPERGRCCHGDEPTLADICLVPQVFNARRWDCDMAGYPTINAICEHCAALPAFRAAAPENQRDAA